MSGVFSDLMCKRVILRHLPTKEEHGGVVIDYSHEGIIVRMDESAKMFIDNDMLVDLRFSKRWELKKVKK